MWLCGVNLNRNFTDYSKTYKVYSIFCICSVLFFNFQTFYWTIYADETFGEKVFRGTFAIGAVITLFRMISLILYQNEITEFFKWIKTCYRTHPEKLIGIYSHDLFEKLLKWIKKLLNIFGLITTVGGSSLIIFPIASGSSNLIVPISIPFMPSKGYPYFEINYVTQAIAVYLTGLAYNSYIFLYIFILTHVSTALDVILAICENVGCYEEKIYEKEAARFDKIKKVIFVEYEPEFRFEKLLPVIVDYHKDVSRFINKISDFYSINILLWELNTVLLSFSSFIIILKYPELLFEFPVVLASASQYFLVTYFSSKIKDKYEKISFVIYCSKWYYLKKRQRSSLLNVMMMSQQTKCMTSGGFAHLSMERFRSVMGFTYNVCVLLKSIFY
uniref:Odorant receptor n=1 Tax=Culicoides sonorensis TaxID=179676 RepID=A0A336LXC6_CULSO